MNETEFDQIKTRIKDLAAMNAVDNAARIERIAIEEALLESPYKSHLYTEQMFDHLAFLELRELNTKLDRLFAHIAPGTTGGTFIHFSHTDSFFGYPHFIQRRMTGRAVLDLCQVDPMVES